MENNNQLISNDPNLQPMTLKDWIITDLLLLIPIANLVLVFVWAFGSDVNRSKKTYFQAQLIFVAIILGIYIIIAILVIAILGATASSLR